MLFKKPGECNFWMFMKSCTDTPSHEMQLILYTLLVVKDHHGLAPDNALPRNASWSPFTVWADGPSRVFIMSFYVLISSISLVRSSSPSQPTLPDTLKYDFPAGNAGAHSQIRKRR